MEGCIQGGYEPLITPTHGIDKTVDKAQADTKLLSGKAINFLQPDLSPNVFFPYLKAHQIPKISYTLYKIFLCNAAERQRKIDKILA